MESYFACAMCRTVSKLTETQARCPACDSMSGTFSPEAPSLQEIARQDFTRPDELR